MFAKPVFILPGHLVSPFPRFWFCWGEPVLWLPFWVKLWCFGRSLFYLRFPFPTTIPLSASSSWFQRAVTWFPWTPRRVVLLFWWHGVPAGSLWPSLSVSKTPRSCFVVTGFVTTFFVLCVIPLYDITCT